VKTRNGLIHRDGLKWGTIGLWASELGIAQSTRGYEPPLADQIPVSVELDPG